ncbi:MAG: hypothetical protein ACM30G_13450 [Micromonosporaceae bacterium]
MSDQVRSEGDGGLGAVDEAHAHHALGERLSALEHRLGAAGIVPAWQRRTRGEHRWPAALAVLAAIALQFVLPAELALQPRWLLPAVEIVLFVVLVAASPTRINRESRVLRTLGLLLVLAVGAANAISAGLLGYRIVTGETDAPVLLLHGATVWFTNVIVFALWYWEADRGGPAARANGRRPYPDFLFAEMTVPQLVPTDWEPTFVDYFFLSFTNATAFSPTDTIPLTSWAKLTMTAQATVSLVTVALVVSRAVNILG